jgi:hypothetical protein
MDTPENETMIFSDKFSDDVYNFKRHMMRDENKSELTIRVITIHISSKRNHRGFYLLIPIKNIAGEYEYEFRWACYDTNREVFNDILNELTINKPDEKERVLNEMEKEENDIGLFFFTLIIEEKNIPQGRPSNAMSMVFYIDRIVEKKKMLFLSMAAMFFQSLISDETDDIFSGNDAEYFDGKENDG